MQEPLCEMMELVRENRHKAQQRQKCHYDRGANEWKIEVDHDEVLFLFISVCLYCNIIISSTMPLFV